MCKYCEKQKTEEPENSIMVDLLADSDDFMACIGEISPIAKRRYPDCTGEIQVHFSRGGITASIPIKYCPNCGRKL